MPFSFPRLQEVVWWSHIAFHSAFCWYSHLFFFFFLSCNSCSPITSYSLVSRCSSDLQTFRCVSECCSKLLCCVRVRSACICACSSGGRSFGQRGEGRELQGEGCILNSGVFLFCFGFFFAFSRKQPTPALMYVQVFCFYDLHDSIMYNLLLDFVCLVWHFTFFFWCCIPRLR